jgi:hypothetical protein
LKGRPDHAELSLLLLVNEEVDHRLEFVCRHVVGVGDLGQLRVLQIERRLLAGRSVIVLERDIAFPFGIEKRGIGIELPGLLGKIGERIALQDGRDAVDLVLIANEVKARLALAQELVNVFVLGPNLAIEPRR